MANGKQQHILSFSPPLAKCLPGRLVSCVHSQNWTLPSFAFLLLGDKPHWPYRQLGALSSYGKGQEKGTGIVFKRRPHCKPEAPLPPLSRRSSACLEELGLQAGAGSSLKLWLLAQAQQRAGLGN